MRIGVAADHGGFELKEQLATALREAGHEVADFGACRMESGDDYPDFVVPLARPRWRAARWNAGWRSAAAASARASPPTRCQKSAPAWSTNLLRPPGRRG